MQPVISLAQIRLVGCLSISLLVPLRASGEVQTPLLQGQTLIIGILGGAERYDDSDRSVRRLALDLGSQPGRFQSETFANIHAGRAWDLVRRALDRDQNGQLDDSEKAAARIVLYGQSLGGSAAIRLARRLGENGIPVLLTVQVDSVGFGDAEIPDNVHAAANFYQQEGFPIQGRRKIHAADPGRTRILCNQRWREDQAAIDDSRAGWWRRKFGGPHGRMERDDALWLQVKELILRAASASGRI